MAGCPTVSSSAAQGATTGHPPHHGDGPCEKGPLLPALRIAATEDRDAERYSQLIVEKEVLLTKLGRTSRAIQGLVTELASSRRECRRKQLEIDSLRAENASVAAAATGDGTPPVELASTKAEVRRLTERCRKEMTARP